MTMMRNQHSSDVPGQWSNLPWDILSEVADRLGLIDLLRFRLVCKAFLSASSTVTAKMESSLPRLVCEVSDLSSSTGTAKIESLPWFLVYGQGSQCCLLSYGDKCTKTYTLNLPQLEGAICLASSQGWLLVFRKRGSMFFYCPFSHAKIDLPNFPKPKLRGYHTAAFSYPPWSKDCVITVIRCSDENYLELNVLKFGDNWVTHNIKYDKSNLHNITGIAYLGEAFIFLDQYRAAITYCPKTNQVTPSYHGRDTEIILFPDEHKMTSFVPYPPRRYKEKYKERRGLGTQVALGHCSSFVSRMGVRNLIRGLGDASISTCGTLMQFNNIPTVIHNEDARRYCGRRFNGVWIHPRFYDQSTIPKLV